MPPAERRPQQLGLWADTPSTRRPARSLVLRSVIVGVGLLLVLGIAPTALLAPSPPRPVVATVDPGPGREGAPGAARTRDVPVGLAPGTRITTAADVRRYAVRALGAPRADALMAVLGSDQFVGSPVTSGDGDVVYPYRYPLVEQILGGAPPAADVVAWTSLGAALTMLAAQAPFAYDTASPEVNAGPVAFAVLHRAAVHGRCETLLDLLLLVVSDGMTPTPARATEQHRANTACGDDLTPTWLVGQAQLRTFLEGGYPEDPSMPTADAVATMQGLVGRAQHSAAALTGLGDAHLAAAMSRNGDPPFATRRYYRDAVIAYNRAVEYGGGREAAGGLARALIGLGEPRRAIDLLLPLTREDATPGPALEVLVAAQESARLFGDAQATARRLADLGPAAYPRGTGLIPSPQRSFEDTAQDVIPALSAGITRLQPLRSRLAPEGGAGGTAQDLSFIPAFRDTPGLTGTHAACADWSSRRAALLAGDPAPALTITATSGSARPDRSGCFDTVADTAPLRRAATIVRGSPPVTPLDSTDDAAADDFQNLLRWAGQLTVARPFVARWEAERGDTTDTPALRLAEIDFLLGHHDDAAAWFATAARRARLLRYNDDLAVARAELGRSAALIAAGRPAEAEPVLRRLLDTGLRGVAFQSSPAGSGDSAGFAELSLHAGTLLAEEERRTGRLRAAAEDFETVLSWFDRGAGANVRREAARTGAALTYLQLGNPSRATDLVGQALREDPHNPLTLMSAGFIADGRTNIDEAVRLDRLALWNDPGLFPAANDLGVQLYRSGRTSEAREAFEQAIAARPDYALGWFNLAALESASGPHRVFAAQRALGRAYRLDPALRDRRLDLTIDTQVYRTGIDLSKPLPPAWTLADIPRPAPAAAVGLLALVELALAAARTTNRTATQNAEKWFEPLARRLGSLPLLRRAVSPVWAVLATITAFLLAAVHQHMPVTTMILYAVGLLVLIGAAMLTRDLVGLRSPTPPEQRSWAPGMVIGIVAGAVGYPWAPVPVVDDGSTPERPAASAPLPQSATRLHLAAPLTLAVLTVALFVESVWTRVPIAGAWAVAGLIMCASLLLPVSPMDGKRLGTAGIAASAGVIGAAVLLGLGLV